MRDKVMTVAIVKDVGASAYLQQHITEKGKVLGVGHFNQRIVKWHYNGLQPRKKLLLWWEYIKGVTAEIRQTVSNKGIVVGIGGFSFGDYKPTPARKRMAAKVQAKRRRQLGFHPISLIHDGCVWHHVNKNDVVACPPYVHSHVQHVCGDGKIEGVVG